jgi:hypothetical protein
LTGSWVDDKTSHRIEWQKRDATRYVKTIGIATYFGYIMSIPSFFFNITNPLKLLQREFKMLVKRIKRRGVSKTPFALARK